MDESKKRTVVLRAKREILEKSSSSDYRYKSDEDLKVIGVSSMIPCLVILKLIMKGLK